MKRNCIYGRLARSYKISDLLDEIADLKSKKHICPNCRNTFIQPFKCTTCGAQKLYDVTLKSAQAEVARMRPVFNAAMRWSKDPNTGTGYESEMQLTRVCAKAERKAKGK